MTQQMAKLIRSGGDDEAPPLVFIHGFGADHMTWAFLAPAFAKTHCVWTLDLPGHGTADNIIGDGTVETLAQSVWRALDGQVSKPVTLVGHSLGGAVALELQQDFAADIAQLVLLAPSGLVPLQNPHFITRLPQLQTLESATQHLLDLVEVKRLISPIIAEYLLDSLASNERRDALTTIAEALISRSKLFRTLPANTVLIWGEQDRIFPPELLEGQDLGIVPELLGGVGHLLQAEAAQKVARLMASRIESASP